MDHNSAPGPDGFGSAWFAENWELVQQDLMDLFSDFFAGTANIEKINKAFIVLLPKRHGATTPDAFRPISLQNFLVKVITKVLTNRLQLQISQLIDLDQTGFMKGRFIAENFVLATELVQCCHKRKSPTLVLKLDFAKAFDSIEWDSLIKILHARGFPDLWCDWITKLLSSAKSAVLLNGVPGPWISCCRGLRQGDALPPYLFLLVADVLQKIITSDSGIRHSLIDAPCPVLQYADDTLILVRADTSNVAKLRSALDSFTLATGLKINYSKSTAVPLHVDDGTLHNLMDILQCKQDTFPQTYLGLPLSNVKLKLSAFSPLIAKVDKKLSGRSSSLLSQAGRVSLINTVLDGLSMHFMSALLLPAGVRSAIESRRRAFLWTGKDKCRGGNCLVSWDKVCMLKKDGGLGIKRLDTKNACLMLKLLHRIFHPGSSSWGNWILQQVNLVDLSGALHSSHWSSILNLLPVYREITSVHINNGASTSFWLDTWSGDQALAKTYPALFSHAKNENVSVAEVVNTGLHHQLLPRLTRAAQAEKTLVLGLVMTVTLNDSLDLRSSPFFTLDRGLDTAKLYKSYTSESEIHAAHYAFIWHSYAPPKVKFFGWLLVQQRLHCKVNLFHKQMIQDQTCELCKAAPEDAEHLFTGCSVAQAFWSHLGWSSDDLPSMISPWEVRPPEHIPSNCSSTLLLLCFWEIWKHRHEVVFRGQEPILTRLLLSCKSQSRLWSCRLVPGQAAVVDSWCALFSM